MRALLFMRCTTCQVSITFKIAVQAWIASLNSFFRRTALVCSAILHYTHRHKYLNIAAVRKTELILKFEGEAERGYQAGKG
jgi:hypothetical protein